MRVLSQATTAMFVGAVLLISAVSAGPTRKWTDASGQFSVDAEFVEVKSGEVHLRKPDGSVITVPVNKLSEADRLYLSNRVTSKPATAAPAVPGATKPNPADLSLTKLTGADGNISRAAWSKFVQAFRDFDVDSDDALGADELKVAGREDVLLKLADANSDGKLVRAEWSTLARSFTRLDKNQNGALEPSELEAAAADALAKSSGTASLPGGNDPAKPGNSSNNANNGPTTWRGQIQGRGQIELVINGNQIVGREMGPGGQVNDLGSGTYTMTGDGKVGNMDAVYTTGPQQGDVCLGIYQMNGDTLQWCVNNRGQRPQGFSTGNGSWLMQLTRVPAP